MGLPTGSGNEMNLYQVAEQISQRLSNIFLKEENGNRPVYGAQGNSRKIRTGRTIFYSMNIFMSAMEPGLGQPPDSVDRNSGQDDAPVYYNFRSANHRIRQTSGFF